MWPNFLPNTSSPYHVLSIVIMVNEKFRERVAPWQVWQFLLKNWAYKIILTFFIADLSETTR